MVESDGGRDGAPGTGLLVEVGGWVGALLVLGAYMLISYGLIEQGTLYQGMNAIGSIGLLFVSALKRAWQPAALNVVWVLIAVSALVRDAT